MKRSAFSLTEVLVVVAILGLSLAPILTSGVATHRRTRFDEAQQAALAEARALVDLVAALPAGVLDRIAPSSDARPVDVDLDRLFGAEALRALFMPLDGEEAPGRIAFRRTATIKRSSPASFTIGVEVGWTAAGQKPHAVRLVRDRWWKEAALVHDVPLSR